MYGLGIAPLVTLECTYYFFPPKNLEYRLVTISIIIGLLMSKRKLIYFPAVTQTWPGRDPVTVGAFRVLVRSARLLRTPQSL
jgi:hypothetical protein